jgi:hypothetical protein
MWEIAGLGRRTTRRAESRYVNRRANSGAHRIDDAPAKEAFGLLCDCGNARQS